MKNARATYNLLTSVEIVSRKKVTIYVQDKNQDWSYLKLSLISPGLLQLRKGFSMGL